jgi:alpha-beta hydrolase superfamily lysophospholipase
LTTTYQYIQKKTNLAKIPKDLRILILSGSEDPCGNYGEYLNKLCAAYKGQGIKDVFGKLYVDCRHELIHESLKHELFKDVETWILKSEDD